MTHEARQRVREAEQVSDEVIAAWRRAVAILAPDVTVNGYGVLRDPGAMASRIYDAQLALLAATTAMEGVTWPTDADYDQL